MDRLPPPLYSSTEAPDRPPARLPPTPSTRSTPRPPRHRVAGEDWTPRGAARRGNPRGQRGEEAARRDGGRSPAHPRPPLTASEYRSSTMKNTEERPERGEDVVFRMWFFIQLPNLLLTIIDIFVCIHIHIYIHVHTYNRRVSALYIHISSTLAPLKNHLLTVHRRLLPSIYLLPA